MLLAVRLGLPLLALSIPIVVAVGVIGAVIDAVAIRRGGASSAWVSLGLKAVVLVWFALVLLPGGPVEVRLGYMAPLLVFGSLAIPIAVIFTVLDVRLLTHSRKWQAGV